MHCWLYVVLTKFCIFAIMNIAVFISEEWVCLYPETFPLYCCIVYYVYLIIAFVFWCTHMAALSACPHVPMCVMYFTPWSGLVQTTVSYLCAIYDSSVWRHKVYIGSLNPFHLTGPFLAPKIKIICLLTSWCIFYTLQCWIDCSLCRAEGKFYGAIKSIKSNWKRNLKIVLNERNFCSQNGMG